ncbi:unnamed protein product [Dicrocoelium dendriticum]|nr:unnamed protein product [Dicrocoelium dendriticum]
MRLLTSTSNCKPLTSVLSCITKPVCPHVYQHNQCLWCLSHAQPWSFRLAGASFDRTVYTIVLIAGLVITMNMCCTCVVTATQSQPLGHRNSRSLKYLGEQSLRLGNVLTPLYDAIEFPVVHERNEPELNLQYFVQPNRSFWLTITPCTNPLDRIQIIKSHAFNRRWITSRFHGLPLSSNTAATTKLRYGFEVDPAPGVKNPSNYTVSSDNAQIKGVQLSRVHYSNSRFPNDTLNLRLYGKPGNAYAVRFSTRQSPKSAVDGYPIVPEDSGIFACLSPGKHDILNVQWNADSSTIGKIKYCVAINAQVNLYYRCTALARLGQVPLPSNGQDERPKVFKYTDHLRPPSIQSAVYQCTWKSPIKIRLPVSLSRLIPQLGQKNSKRLYVNVYAINTRVDLSSAYEVHILDKPVPLCTESKGVVEYDVTEYKHTLYPVLWNVELIFNWRSNESSLLLFYHPCMLSMTGKSNSYSVHVYKRSNTRQNFKDQEICRKTVQGIQAFLLCSNIGGQAQYRIRVDSSSSFQHGEQIARISFQPANENYNPIRPFGIRFETKLTQILTKPTGVPYASVAQFPSKSNRNRFPSKNVPPRWLQRHPSRWLTRPRRRSRISSAPVPTIASSGKSNAWNEGIKIGVDCQGHQIYVNLTVYPRSQVYAFYTVPISTRLIANTRSLFDKLNSITNHCDFPLAAYIKLTNASARKFQCHTSSDETELAVFTPAHHQHGYPRYYLLLVYVSNPHMHTHKELLGQTLIDACEITRTSCYPNMPQNCMSFYPAVLPKMDPLESTANYRLIHSNKSSRSNCYVI